jgi:hypothetical protein
MEVPGSNFSPEIDYSDEDFVIFLSLYANAGIIFASHVSHR